MFLTFIQNRKLQPATGHAMRTGSRRAPGSASGFTLLELMIVIAIITILVGLAAGAYVKSVQHAKEATLKDDLKVMREAIDRYTLDKEAAPQSLEDLINPQSQYLREIPVDPITNAKDWHVDIGDTVMTPDQTNTGIVEIGRASCRERVEMSGGGVSV